MNIKSLIASIMLGTVVLSFSMHSLADEVASSVSVERNAKKSTSSLSNKRAAEEMPNITNEAEYAEFVKKREGASQASSVKSATSSSARSKHSIASVK